MHTQVDAHTGTQTCTHRHRHAHTGTQTCTQLDAHTYMHAQAHMHTHTCTHAGRRRNACMHSYTYACTQADMHACTHSYVYTDTQIHIHAHTGTHMHTHWARLGSRCGLRCLCAWVLHCCSWLQACLWLSDSEPPGKTVKLGCSAPGGSGLAGPVAGSECTGSSAADPAQLHDSLVTGSPCLDSSLSFLCERHVGV